MKIIISLFLAVFLLSGCLSSNKRVVVNTKELPAWYQNTPQNTENFLYATSQGDTKTTAINRALSEIVASLSVSISSEFTSKTQSSTDSYSLSSSNEVTAKVQEIKISHYEIVHALDYGFERYLVQVKVDKKKLFDALEKETKLKLNSMENKDLNNFNAIKKLNVYTKDLESTKYIKNTLGVMRSLDSSFDDSIYTNKVTRLENRYDDLLSKLSFSIDSNKDARNLKSSVSNGLSDAGYRINKNNGVNHFRIYISSNTSSASSYGFDLARSGVSIKVKDYKGTVIGSNKLNITGQSTQGYNIAKENVALKLNKMIKKEGITKLLGLEL